MTGATDHTRSIFVWLEAIAADPELPATASRLAIVMTRYLNRQTGAAWPSVARLADDLSTTETTVRTTLRALKERKHLLIETGGGNRPNTYRIAINPCKKLKGPPPQNSGGVENCTPTKKLPAPPQFSFVDPPRKLNPNHIERNHCKEPSELNAREIPSSEGFQTFWDAWPNKVGKPAAERAFSRVSKELPDILAGIDRYITTKPADRQWLNPATFLNQRRWEDQPAPAPVAISGPGARAPAARRAASTSNVLERCGVDIATLAKESGL